MAAGVGCRKTNLRPNPLSHDRFNHSHISFFAWAGLYFTTPFLVFAIWLRNRPQDTGQIEPGDIKVPLLFRLGTGRVVSAMFACLAWWGRAWPWRPVGAEAA